MINRTPLISSQNGLKVFLIFVLSISLSLSCGSLSDREKAAKIIDEINQTLATDEQSLNRLSDDVKRNLSKESIDRFPASRAVMEVAVRTALPFYDHELNKFNSVTSRFEEIEKLNLNREYLESISIQKRLYGYYSEGIELQKARLLLILDKNISDSETLKSRAEPIELRLTKLKQEIESLEVTRKNTEQEIAPPEN